MQDPKLSSCQVKQEQKETASQPIRLVTYITRLHRCASNYLYRKALTLTVLQVCSSMLTRARRFSILGADSDKRQAANERRTSSEQKDIRLLHTAP